MADSHDGAHHGPSFTTYMIVAGALAVCTASSFVVNQFVYAKSLTPVQGFLLILGVALVKAYLVGYIFMHLKWDWRLLYFIIVPAFVLGAMMVTILAPDTLIGPSRDMDESILIGQAQMDKWAVK